MKLGVISDTHLSGSGGKKLAGRVFQGISEDVSDLFRRLAPHFSGVQAVLHAGDILEQPVLDMLSRFGEVHAVAGNMDPDSTRTLLPERKIIELGGFRIGLIHGWGSPQGLAQRVRERFAGERVDCIVFGHSHQAYDRTEAGILMFNPGSATDRRFALRRSIGLLYLEEKIWGQHVELD